MKTKYKVRDKVYLSYQELVFYVKMTGELPPNLYVDTKYCTEKSKKNRISCCQLCSGGRATTLRFVNSDNVEDPRLNFRIDYNNSTRNCFILPAEDECKLGSIYMLVNQEAEDEENIG